MDIANLFESAKNIEIPGDMQTRIIANCQRCIRKRPLPIRKPLLIAAALLTLLGISAVGMVRSGYFQDIKNSFGTVIGTEYLNATEEICVQASLSDGALSVHISFVQPDMFPYRTTEQLAIGSCRITDANGTVHLTQASAASIPVADGEADIIIPLNAPLSSPCTLQIDSFISTKKADQPLEIKGSWSCNISE